MAVDFICSDPQALLKAFNARIAQTEPKGKITTWEVNDGGYYTHRAPDWSRKAWFKPLVTINKLTFNIIRSQNDTVSSVAYAYYHGHLIETFLAHFDESFSKANASAMPDVGDRVRE
jgi:hypothetical protein